MPLTDGPFPTAARLALFYAAFFVVIGILLPFWPVWLEARRLNAEEIGVLLAFSVGAKVVSNPIVAHLADRRGERRRLMAVLAIAAFVSFVLFSFADGFWPLLAVSLLFYIVWPPIMPLGESLTMLAARDRGIDYGRVRLWGSLAFIAASVGGGWALVGQPAGMIYWMALGAVAVAVVSCAQVPDLRSERSSGVRLPMIQVLRDRRFPLFIVAAALVQGSHAVYYAFGTLHWQGAGYSEDVIGGLWAEGVIAEVVLLALGAGLIRRVGAERLLMLGGIAAAVRWTATGLTDALPVLVAVQVLHAFTFGAAHLAAVHFIARTVAPALSATAQSLYAALVMGLGMGIMLYAAGHLYAELAGYAYLTMGAVGALGAVAAWRLARMPTAGAAPDS